MGAAEIKDSHSFPDYSHGPPWMFKGRALYQLHLVKAKIARRFIPKELKLVEAFGYTLGGMFLAHYDASPAGVFDELVVIAGIVWNPPTSCAWAARVLVNNHEACKHGRKEIGLPSYFANFSKKTGENLQTPRKKQDSVPFCNPKVQTNIEIIEAMDNGAIALCNITLPLTVLESKQNKKWMGPLVRLSLPSFSGKTMDNPHLLKYACHIECRMSVVEPAKISRLTKDKLSRRPEDQKFSENMVLTEKEGRYLSISMLLSKPIIALQFSSLMMHVEAPTILSSYLKTKKSEVSKESSQAPNLHITKPFVG
uniref:Isoleucine--tRNA ligase n=2 Tax=Anthurium amnicola TaxID=1678845 RepID=A0A1D1XTY1_9ARAE